MDVSDGGKNLTVKLMSDLINQEIELIQASNPDRNLTISDKNGSKASTRWVTTFAKRNDLFKYISMESKFADKKIVECDICCKKFTTEKNMLSHRKVVHFGFL